MMPHQLKGPGGPGDLPEPPRTGSAGKKDAVEQQFHTGGPVKAHLVDALADMMGMGPGHPVPKPARGGCEAEPPCEPYESCPKCRSTFPPDRDVECDRNACPVKAYEERRERLIQGRPYANEIWEDFAIGWKSVAEIPPGAPVDCQKCGDRTRRGKSEWFGCGREECPFPPLTVELRAGNNRGLPPHPSDESLRCPKCAGEGTVPELIADCTGVKCPVKPLERHLSAKRPPVGTKHDAGKVRMELLPPEFLNAVAEIITFGAEKYAPRDWEQGMDYGRVYGALQRHLNAWWSGQDTDDETGKSHLWHAGACLAFLITYEQRGVGKDDRPRRVA